jgi:mannose-1-phosphate guanylyltransferase/mannose-6-phosphate isomerase
MSGGSGTRLWPISTDDKPKQFHALASELTMLQETALRFDATGGLQFAPPIVICNQQHGALAYEQLSDLGVSPSAVILEPFGRNTASVAVIAAAWVRAHAPGALAMLLPADHVIADPERFRAVIATAAEAATDRIVTFGIEPTGPETGYGYIQRGDALYDGVFRIVRFVEKPDRETAEGYLAEGGYSWNGGIFLYAPDTLLAEAERHCPEIMGRTIEALDRGGRDGVFIDLDREAFAACPSQPVDIAIMEKTDKAAVAPCDIGWADVGSWSELWRQGPRDTEDNFIKGEAIVLDTEESLIWTNGPMVATIGVKDLIVIATADHVLVLPKDRAQDVKRIVEQLKRKSAL